VATVSAVVGTISTLVALVISVTQFRWAAEERRERRRYALANVTFASPTITHEPAAVPVDDLDSDRREPAPVDPAPIPSEPPIDVLAAPQAAPVEGQLPQPRPLETTAPVSARTARRAIRKTQPTRQLQPGELICGECGEGNAPARKFCKRCGHSLASAETVRRPVWKKLWPTKKVKTLEVGERPGRAGTKGTRRPSLWPLIAFVVLAIASGIVFVLS
jgi:hypothetical protein